MHFNSLDSSSTKTRDFQINFLFYLSPPQETFESSRHTILKVQFLSNFNAKSFVKIAYTIKLNDLAIFLEVDFLDKIWKFRIVCKG